MSDRAVTVCIPAFNAERFIAETIESALAQTWPRVEVVVSVDRCADRTAEIVGRYAAREAVRMIQQPNRLGWVGNTNAALRMARTPFAMNLPHDDGLDRRYVAACVDALAATPSAAVAFSDIAWAEALPAATQPSAIGPLEHRLSSLMREQFRGIAVRGVVDRRRAPRHLLPGFALAGFAADTLWCARMACQGGLVRVPEVLYRKRWPLTSVLRAWFKGARGREGDEMWVVHCTEMLATVLMHAPGLARSRRFRQAVRARVLHEQPLGPWGRGVSDLIAPGRPLLPQMLTIYARVALRRPHYSWQTMTR